MCCVLLSAGEISKLLVKHFKYEVVVDDNNNTISENGKNINMISSKHTGMIHYSLAVIFLAFIIIESL
jgi:hypothetical protein